MSATRSIGRHLNRIKSNTAKHFFLRPIACTILFCATAFVGFAVLPEVSLRVLGLKAPALPSSSGGAKIYDRKNQLVSTIYGERDLQPVPLKNMSANLKNAIIAAEDHDFYSHDGIDVLAICRAILVDLTAGHAIQGGSTISQQLVKNLYFEGKRRTFVDKAKEAIMAIDMEQRYSKAQILEAYLNYVYFGNGVYGIERASERYFGKSSSKLTIAEAAYLAALVNAPSELSLVKNRKEAIARQHFVLNSMQQLNFAKASDVEKAKKQVLTFHTTTNASRRYRYYTSEVLQQVRKELNLDEDEVYSKGLQIYTNLDTTAQAQAEAALANGIRRAPRGINQGALVSISVPDAAIIAMVGGAGKFENNQWNRATSPHTAGSAFKPFVYLAALSKGVIYPDSLIEDEPLEVRQPGCPVYRPKNFDGQYLGQITIRKALALSRNTCAVRVAQAVGPNEVVRYAHMAGINSKLDENLALALGASAVSPVEMANAYATLARDGEIVEPIMVRHIDDEKGNVLKSFQQRREHVFPAEPVAELVDALQDVVEKGTGTRARLFDRPVAGKTGTSDQARDIWFIGFTPDLVTAVWGGNEENKPVGGHATGGTIMAGIWQAYTRSYYEQHTVPVAAFVAPEHPLLEEAEPLHILPAPASIFDRLFGPFESHEPQIKEYEWRGNPGIREERREDRRIERDMDDDPPEPEFKPHKKKKALLKRFLNWLDF
jgi:1A family penicillin-binding protein